MTSIIFMTGPPGSGKSTISRLLAKRHARCFLISVDDLREMMVSGCATPEGGWSQEKYDQFQWAREAATQMAEAYAGRGINVIIDDVCVPSFFADHYKRLFANPACRRILLLPTREALTERIRKRRGPWDTVLIDFIPGLYDELEPMCKEGWTVLDSSNWTIEQTVDEVVDRLASPD